MNNLLTSILAFLLSLISGWMTPVTVIATEPVADNAITQDLTIMNYNVYVMGVGKKSPENRTAAVAEQIRSQMPDSFGVEEADEGWRQRLSEALPEYASVGLGRDAGDAGEASPVFYLKEKYELVDSETIWLSKTPEKPSHGWDAMFNRVATIAVLRDKTTGFTYAHVNAHFDNTGSIARCESVAIISQKINELALPCVFTGDLNAKENTLMYERILDSGLRDTKYLALSSDSGATYHGYAWLDKWNDEPIDYIFVNGYCTSVASYQILDNQIDGIYPSDHYPVVSRLTMAYNP